MLVDYSSDLVAAIWAVGALASLVFACIWFYIFADTAWFNRELRWLAVSMAVMGVVGMLCAAWFLVSAMVQVV